jgi:hypothetical protein
LDHLQKLSQFAPALGTALVRRISILSFSQVASSSPNARGNGTQAFGHTLGRLTFTDKRIGASREGGLLTGVQMADEDNDQRGRTGRPEFIQSRTRRGAGEQIPINQQHIGTTDWCLR